MSANDNANTLLYPPLPAEELRDAHTYENVERVVVTQSGVWLLSRGGGWVRAQPIAEITGRAKT